MELQAGVTTITINMSEVRAQATGLTILEQRGLYVDVMLHSAINACTFQHTVGLHAKFCAQLTSIISANYIAQKYMKDIGQYFEYVLVYMSKSMAQVCVV